MWVSRPGLDLEAAQGHIDLPRMVLASVLVSNGDLEQNQHITTTNREENGQLAPSICT